MDENVERRERVRALLADYGPEVSQVCDACVAHLPGVSGAGLAVMTGPPAAQHTWYASDAVSHQIEEMQFVLGEGPCKDAFRDGQPVLVADLGSPAPQARWPAFTPAAWDAGARALFALPLQVGAVRVGVIDLYRDAPGALSGDELADALVFADAATQLLLAAGDSTGAGELTFDIGRRAVIHQATGMVKAQLDVPIEEAFVRLRARAYSSGRALEEVARDVVARRLRFHESSD